MAAETKKRRRQATSETIWIPVGFISRNKTLLDSIEKNYNHSLWDRQEEYAESGIAFSSREGEKQLINLILQGNVPAATSALGEIDNHGLYMTTGHLSANALRQARYSITSFIAICCRAVVDHGCPESEAYLISDAFIQALDQLDNVADSYSLMFGVVAAYTRLVSQTKNLNLSIPTQKCLEYISDHIHAVITLPILAKHCGLTKNYLSDLFEKEMGCRPMAYIRKEKLHYAAEVLMDESLTVAEISQILAFPSPSAFAKAFKEEFSMSPAEYRRKIRH